MSLKLIAVDGMTVVEDLAGLVFATITVLPPTATKVKAEGKLVHRDGDQVIVTAITFGSATIADPGPYTVPLNATVTKVKAEGKEVLVEGNLSDTIDATPKVPGSPPTDSPISFKCKISVAGQTKAKAQ